MLTYGLESAIQKGIAKERTFVYGAGAVGRIPCPKGSFIIIHHFDYWHFVDTPAGVAAKPAIGQLILTSADPALVDNATIDFGVLGSFGAIVDFGDPAGTELQVQTGMDTIVTGWTVVVSSGVPGSLRMVFTTSTPGTAYNGIVPGYTSTAIIPPAVVSIPFAGGVDAAAITLEEFLQHTEHQLEFRSKKSRNHFLIREPVEIVPAFSDPAETSFFANCGGYYAKDCYLVHVGAVQINILGVPPVADWGVTYAPLNEKSQETPPPSGYGVAGFPNANTVREVIFDAAGNTQQYLPLTSEFDNTAIIPGEYRGEFKVDVNAINALENPQNVSNIKGNFKTYPLVNISFVQVDMNYDEFVKGSI